MNAETYSVTIYIVWGIQRYTGECKLINIFRTKSAAEKCKKVYQNRKDLYSYSFIDEMQTCDEQYLNI